MSSSSLSSTSTRVTYAVGDFVYFDDTSATDAPYQIRKIEELVKTEKGGVDARCVVYLRRRDIPQHLLKIADQAQRRFDNYYEVDKKKPENFTTKGFIVVNGASEAAPEAAPEATEASAETSETKVKEDTDDVAEKMEEDEECPAPVGQGRTSSTEEPSASDAPAATAKDKKEEKEAKENAKNLKETAEAEATKLIDWGDGGLPLGVDKLTPDQRLKLRQHEIFMTRQSEILPAAAIRGKCRVVLLGDGEEAQNYLPLDDTFYHSLVYDPNAQTLLADKGAIRVGEKYQAVVDEWMEPADREAKEAKVLAEKVKKEEEEAKLKAEAEEDTENDGLTIAEDEEMPELKNEEKEETKVEEEATTTDSEGEVGEVLVWHPHHALTDRDIDQYMIVARSVGLFARAIDGASAPKLPTLQLAAAFASRDVTIFHAHAILHQANYDVGQAVKYLVPVASRDTYPCQVDDSSGLQTKTLGGPILCRDQLEEWSTPEMNLFEDALDKVGKDFNEIRAEYLPWKSIRDIVEYYYLMKASNRYTDRKKNKPSAGGGSSTTTDEKFTNIYIPPFNKPIAASILPYNTSQTTLMNNDNPCENCGTLDALNWYQWGGVGDKKVLCSTCWIQWKKFAGLNQKHELERFDKTRPPPVEPVAPTPAASNGTPASQKAAATAAVNTLTPQQQQQQRAAAANMLMTLNSGDKQNLLNVAKEALARGQITQEQFLQLQKNFAQKIQAQIQQQIQQQQQRQAQTTPQVVATPRKKTTPATKPAIVFYTTICRRAVRRILPKSAFNLRKLSRRPNLAIDDEKILRAMIMLDKKHLLQSAQAAAGDKRSLIVESEFHKGITHLQHALTQAATGKRSAPQAVASGEPSAKMAKV
ncbi:DIOX_N domain-containing protein [Caenorhabditis elegans]|uniref:DIOX_N domain-containing protein n=1 Tax=Caenorhabditis elegans TaxID=6239 RepID=Q86S28_CAEEL|nr:DIOX_N domain-containing protein [Caenorhabditis elegans]CCD74258.1 DIOX_N domain-containing protein [Caenorhabditis elegans]|eukprot:NP_872124.1 Uncharacterized protein CELE_T27C4.4 [Caenorhabditis elegans]